MVFLVTWYKSNMDFNQTKQEESNNNNRNNNDIWVMVLEKDLPVLTSILRSGVGSDRRGHGRGLVRGRIGTLKEGKCRTKKQQ